MRKFLFFALLLSSAYSFAQIGMNQWRVHFSAFTAKGICETSDAVYMACANGIIKYDTEDNSLQDITPINGLSELSISKIASHNNIVFIGYANGNLDVLKNNTVTNIPWIKAADVGGDKTIFNFCFDGNLAYVSTGLGLIVYDIEKNEIKDTYYPYNNPLIYDATIHQDTIFVGTPNGIYCAHKDQPYLNDFNNWRKKTNLPESMVDKKIPIIESFGDRLYFLLDSDTFNLDTIIYIKDNITNYFEYDIDVKDFYVDKDDNVMLVNKYASVQSLNIEGTYLELIFQYPFKSVAPVGSVLRDGQFWIADSESGLVKALNSWSAQTIYSNGPATDAAFKLDIQYGKAVIAGGGLTPNRANIFDRSGIYVFEDENWTNLNFRNQEEMDFDVDWDFISVAVNPNNTNEFAFGSFSLGGLKIVKDGKDIVEAYDPENSNIEINGGQISIGDMKYDQDGNLWILNAGIEPLKVFTPDGNNYSFSLGASARNRPPIRLIIDQNNVKWAGFAGGGLIAFDDGGTLADQSDDQIHTLTTAEGFGNLPNANILSVAADADGEIWIGTAEGLVILYSTANLFSNEYGAVDANPILIRVDSENERLFGTSSITAIAIDGGNRKWIGTASAGVFCISEDGKEEIYNFTAENSPLISNSISDIQVDQLSGEVYFATTNGLVSFRSDATLADPEFSEVTVFPNPVRPEFSGPITIQGLGYESDVKITDISGNVLYQTVSNGGTVIWNGKTLYGDRAQSGVYLVWTGSVTGKGKNVAKILFIN